MGHAKWGCVARKDVDGSPIVDEQPKQQQQSFQCAVQYNGVLLTSEQCKKEMILDSDATAHGFRRDAFCGDVGQQDVNCDGGR